jgi:hypothetical protein
MTQEMLKRLVDGQLPMQFFVPADIDRLQNLRDAGYLKVSFKPLEQNRRTSATVTEVTPLGRAAIRYFGYGYGSGTRH